jgi:ATP-dependent helicase/nuclease subunit A
MSVPFQPPGDQAARLAAVAGRGSVLVQAPAGSGKTTLLVQRYLRLLAQVDGPERILALTFTRRAAEEMRERVLAAIRAASAAHAAPESACPAGLNPETWVLAAAARRHLDALGIDVESSRLRIETIDSFNAWLAAQLPITSGAGGRLRLLEDARSVYAEAAARALSHEAADAFGEAVERLLVVGDQRWRQLAEMVAEMLPARDRWLPLLVGHVEAAGGIDEGRLVAVRRQFDEDLALLVTRTLRNAHDALGDDTVARLSALARGAGRRVGADRPDLAAWRVDGKLRPEPGQVGHWRALADLFLNKSSKLRKRFGTAEGFPGRAERDQLSELVEEFERRPEVVPALLSVRALPDPAYRDEDWAGVRAAAQVLVLAAAELEQIFRERGVVDFPAVSMAALRALGSEDAPTDLNLRLDYTLEHVLIDEFQDTSTAQLELLARLTAGWQPGDGRTIFCVGDPMQSIYGFRQAEVRAFLDLAEAGLGAVRFEVQRLSSNFRSDRALVDWINTRFARVMPRLDDRERGAIAFRPSESALPAAVGFTPEVRVCGFGSRETEALAVAEAVEMRRKQHPEWRIAILVRARTHAREIAHALRTRGLAFRAVDIEPLEDRPAVRDMVALTAALLHLGDRTAWLAVLRAPWAGLELKDLLTVARANPVIFEALRDDAVLERLSEEGAIRCRRLRSVFEAAFRVQTHTPVARWVERTWLALGGAGSSGDARAPVDARADALANVRAEVRRVLARLRELEQRGLPDAADLTQSFAGLYADGGAPGAIEIMTIHKAKGLEFDFVIVPALDRHARTGRGQLLLMHSFARTGRDGMAMAARPPIGAGNDPLFGFLRFKGRDAAALEAERLLYVACTRAKRQLHLTATIGLRIDPEDEAEEDADDTAEPENALWKPRAGSLLAVLWPSVRDEVIADARRQGKGTAPPIEPELRGGPLRRVPSGFVPPSFVAPFDAPRPGAGAREEAAPPFDWAGETARRVGSLVHAELQTLDLERSDQAAIRARETHFRRWLTLAGVPEEHLAEASARAMAALLAVHGDPRGRWILKNGYRDDFREHAISGRRGGEVMRAVFDRSFIDELGTRWVIDYKTSRHAGGGVEEFLRREVERYRPQLERYALLARKLGPEPVRVGLYFPLMPAWREWDPEQ